VVDSVGNFDVEFTGLMCAGPWRVGLAENRHQGVSTETNVLSLCTHIWCTEGCHAERKSGH